MERANKWIGLGLMAALVAGGFGIQTLANPPASAAAAVQAADFTGVWKLDLARSDSPRGGMRGEEGGRGMRRPDGVKRADGVKRGDGMKRAEGSERGDGMKRADGTARRGGEGHRGRGLGWIPATMAIQQSGGVIRVADSTGAVFQQIAIGSASADTSVARTVHGEWKASGLEIHRGRGGRNMTETWSVEPDGRTLVMLTRVESESGAREFKRVYVRAGQ